jgi:peptidoglycan/LPS O-acetylase OafA/YrhL
MAVMVSHGSLLGPRSSSLAQTIFSTGWVGVDLFFVLSGYLIAGQIFKINPLAPLYDRFKEFWFKRWTRTVPLYLAVLFVYIFLKPLLGWKFNGDPLPYFFFLQNFFPMHDFDQSWSLCIEEQFYFIFPIIYFFLFKENRWRWIWLIFLGMGPILRSLLISQNPEAIWEEALMANLIHFKTVTHLDGIVMGVFLASTEKWWLPFSKSHAALIFNTGVVLFVGVAFMAGPYPVGPIMVWDFLALSICFAIMLIGARSIKIMGPLDKIFGFISLISYGLYLWNNLVARVIEKGFYKLSWSLKFFIFFLTSMTLSYLSYRFIEKPGMNLRNRWISKP